MTWLYLPLIVFLSPPTFWEARDQPEPGSFFDHSLLWEDERPWERSWPNMASEVLQLSSFWLLLA